MFAHKEISHKVHKTNPFRKRSTYFSVRLPRTMWTYFVCVLSVLYTVSELILRCESFSLLFVRHYTILCAHQSKRRAWVRLKRLRMRDEDLTVICDRMEKKTKPEFQLGRLPWKARVIKYNAYLDWNTITFNIWSCIQKLSFLPHSGRILLEREFMCLNMYLA